MLISEARAALNVPVETVNNNCVRDGQVRLREALAFDEKYARIIGKPLTDESEASAEVVRTVKGLRSWIAHHYEQERRYSEIFPR